MLSSLLPPDIAAAVPLIAVAAFLAGLARGFSGFGAAMIYMPLAAAILGPVTAMPVLLMSDLAVASPMIAKAARCCDWPEVRRVAIGGVAGIPVGNLLLTNLPAVTVRWVVTLLILVSLLLMVGGWRLPGRQSTVTAAIVGVLAGLMSGLAQIGGPPVVMYWMSARIEPARMRANLIVYFAIIMWFSLALFAVRGLLSQSVLWLAIASAPAYAAGIYTGAASFGLASPSTFKWLSIGLCALATIIGMPLLDPWLR